MRATIWAATWQNQQNECAPSEDSDQPGHPPSLIRVFAVRFMGSQEPKLSSCGQRRLIRLGRCPGWSESSLGAHSLCWFYHVAAHILREFKTQHFTLTFSCSWLPWYSLSLSLSLYIYMLLLFFFTTFRRHTQCFTVKRFLLRPVILMLLWR